MSGRKLGDWAFVCLGGALLSSLGTIFLFGDWRAMVAIPLAFVAAAALLFVLAARR